MTNFDKYNLMHEEIMFKMENGEITIECARQLNDLAFNKYIAEASMTEDYMMDELFTEGANWDLHKEYRQTLKAIRTQIRDTKKLITAKKFDDARENIKKAREELENYKEKTTNLIDAIDPKDLKTAIFGWMFRDLTIACKDLIWLIIPFAGGIAYTFSVSIQQLQDIIEMIQKWIDGDKFEISQLNTYVNFIKKSYETFDKTLNAIEKAIDLVEENEAKKEEAKNAQKENKDANDI